MTFPERVRIGSIDYKLVPEYSLATDNGRWGEIRYGSAEIAYLPSLEWSRLREVVVHEMTHAILMEAGYDEHTEEQADRIGRVLAMVLRDNDLTILRDGEGG